MKPDEERLRAAMRAQANSVSLRGDGWQRIETRLAKPLASRSRYLVIPLAAAVVGAMLVTLSMLGDDGPDRGPVVAAPTTMATRPSTSTSTSTSTTAAPPPAALWPQGGARTFTTPAALASSFGADFLGMPHPVVSAFRQNEPNAGEIDIRPNARAGIHTVLSVMRGASGWFVNDALSPNIELDAPADQQLVASPIRLAGRSIAFEGTVHMTLLPSGASLKSGLRLGDGTFTGHGTEPGPFRATLAFRQPPTSAGLLVLWTDSAEDGSIVEATVRRVVFAG